LSLILSASSLAAMATAARRQTRRRFGRLSIAAYLGLGIGGAARVFAFRYR
jgi:hypothetical protein